MQLGLKGEGALEEVREGLIKWEMGVHQIEQAYSNDHGGCATIYSRGTLDFYYCDDLAISSQLQTLY